MESVCFSCEGFQLGPLAVPPLEVHRGELVCLHLPYLPSLVVQLQLIRLLTGVRRAPAVHCQGRIVWAEPAAARGGFLPHLFNRQSAIAWLCHTAGISRSEARAISERLGIDRHTQVEALSANPRNLLGVEAAWARRADAIVFSTAGCDFDGIRATYEAVLARLEQHAAIHLSYPYVIPAAEEYRPISPRLDEFAAQDPGFPRVRVERCCSHRAICHELSEERVPSVRV
jgi:hypothetical protein